MGTTYTYLGYTVLAVALGVAAGIFVYLAVSFGIMRAHVAPRGASATVRELVRETAWVVLTQPLIPLYYLRGHGMGGEGPGDPIVFVHGYFQNRANFLGVARAIRRAKIAPMFGFNYPWVLRVEKNAERLGRFVEKVCAATGKSRVALVAHSLGGLVALEYAHSDAGAKRVSKCVTIASPHAGVPWQGPILGEVGTQMRRGSEFLVGRAGRKILIPTLSIYSTHDNVVHPPQTSMLASRGGTDLAIDGLGHLSILFDARVANAVVDFLRTAPPATVVEAAS